MEEHYNKQIADLNNLERTKYSFHPEEIHKKVLKLHRFIKKYMNDRWQVNIINIPKESLGNIAFTHEESSEYAVLITKAYTFNNTLEVKATHKLISYDPDTKYFRYTGTGCSGSSKNLKAVAIDAMQAVESRAIALIYTDKYSEE